MIPCLFLRALDHTIDELRRERGSNQLGPRPLQSGTELVEHVAHPVLATGEVEREIGAHERPAETGPVGDRIVELSGCRDVVGDEMEDLPPHGLLETIRQESFDLVADTQRVHVEVAIDLLGDLQGDRSGVVPTDNLDEGQKVHRVEWMAYNQPLGVT